MTGRAPWEWAYDRQSSIGHLDKALDEAQSCGWTVLDMKRDLPAGRRGARRFSVRGAARCPLCGIESVESPVDLVEVPEHVASKLGELAGHLVESAVYVGEPVVDRSELASQEVNRLLILARGHGP